MILLGVNIDHVATLRNARGGVEPDPLTAAELAMLGGASSITVHLREDRRHIRDRDVRLLRERNIPLNLEMSMDYSVAEIALDVCPQQVTIVPEKREEVTTESGLDVIRHARLLAPIVGKFREKGVNVSLFVDPDVAQLQSCLKAGARTVELHTGAFANARNHAQREKEVSRLALAAVCCMDSGIALHAGHGLNYFNTMDILHLPGLREVNIGHSIVSRAVLVGLEKAVQSMRDILNLAHCPGPEISARRQKTIEDCAGWRRQAVKNPLFENKP